MNAVMVQVARPSALAKVGCTRSVLTTPMPLLADRSLSISQATKADFLDSGQPVAFGRFRSLLVARKSSAVAQGPFHLRVIACRRSRSMTINYEPSPISSLYV